jgi:hypothetical protein
MVARSDVRQWPAQWVDAEDTVESWRDALPNSSMHEMPSGLGARPAEFVDV